MTEEPQSTLAALTAEIDVMIRAWSKGGHSHTDAIFSSFFGGDPFGGYRRGGRLTWHEAIFAKWFHHLEPQVTIGTGPGGRNHWGASSYTVDFLDRSEGTVWELDGPSHKSAAMKRRDARKDAFLQNLGYEVVRVPNSFIEQWAKDVLVDLAECQLGLRPGMEPVHRRRYEALQPFVATWLKDKAAMAEFANRPVAPSQSPTANG